MSDLTDSASTCASFTESSVFSDFSDDESLPIASCSCEDLNQALTTEEEEALDRPSRRGMHRVARCADLLYSKQYSPAEVAEAAAAVVLTIPEEEVAAWSWNV